MTLDAEAAFLMVTVISSCFHLMGQMSGPLFSIVEQDVTLQDDLFKMPKCFLYNPVDSDCAVSAHLLFDAFVLHEFRFHFGMEFLVPNLQSRLVVNLGSR